MATFSKKLSTLMDRSGLTTREVGTAVGLDHSAVARWMKGTRPYRSSISKLADYFQVPVEVLTDDTRDLPVQYAREQAHATDLQEATVLKDGLAQPKGVSMQSVLGDARAIAQQLRELADKLDPPLLPAADPGALERGKKNLDEIVTRGRAAEQGNRQRA